MSTRERGGERRGPRAIGELLKGFLKESKAGRAVTTEALAEAWRGAVGPEVAHGTRVRGLRDGVLTVEVESSALLSELSTFYRGSILVALREKGSVSFDVRDVSFKLGEFGRA